MRQGSRQPRMQESERQQSAESDEVGAVDAAQAFEALQAEVALQRRAIEALGEALDGMLEGRAPPNLSPDIARILQGQAHVAQHVEQLRLHPALKLTPVQYGEALAQAGSAVVREAAQQLKNATQEVERERAQLRELVGSVQGNRRHRRLLWWAFPAALAAGLVLSPLLMRSLPVGLSSQAAAFLVKQDRWAGGALLMQLESPAQWLDMAEAMRLARVNEAVLTACRNLAIKSSREQRCTIFMPAP
jgi:hypothetical protein